MTDHPPRNEMWVTCTPCSRTWVIAFLPMESSKITKVMKGTRCAKCGEHKGISLARESAIVATLQIQRAGGI